MPLCRRSYAVAKDSAGPCAANGRDPDVASPIRIETKTRRTGTSMNLRMANDGADPSDSAICNRFNQEVNAAVGKVARQTMRDARSVMPAKNLRPQQDPTAPFARERQCHRLTPDPPDPSRTTS